MLSIPTYYLDPLLEDLLPRVNNLWSYGGLYPDVRHVCVSKLEGVKGGGAYSGALRVLLHDGRLDGVIGGGHEGIDALTLETLAQLSLLLVACNLNMR